MGKVVAIVEGHGEVAALPILLRRLGAWKTPNSNVDVLKPVRVSRDRFINKTQEFERHLNLAASKCGDGGWILVVLDADDDCPATLGENIFARATECIPHRRISVVLPIPGV